MKSQQALEDLEEFVRSNFDDLLVSMSISSTGTLFLNIWQQPSELNNGYIMKYNPLFHVIATVDENSNLTLRLITFHGKIVSEKSDGDTQLTTEEKLNFVKRLQQSNLCKGFEMTETGLRLDPKHFSSTYLVEQFEENVIVRSRNCNFAVTEEKPICVPCLNLSNKDDVEIKPKTDVTIKKSLIKKETEIITNGNEENEYDDNVLKILRNCSQFMNEQDVNEGKEQSSTLDKAQLSSRIDSERNDILDINSKDIETGNNIPKSDMTLERKDGEEKVYNVSHEEELQWLCRVDPSALDMSTFSMEEISRKRKAYYSLKQKAKKLKLEIGPDEDLDLTNGNEDYQITSPFSKRKPPINSSEGDIKPFRYVFASFGAKLLLPNLH